MKMIEDILNNKKLQYTEKNESLLKIKIINKSYRINKSLFTISYIFYV